MTVSPTAIRCRRSSGTALPAGPADPPSRGVKDAALALCVSTTAMAEAVPFLAALMYGLAQSSARGKGANDKSRGAL